MLFVNLRKLLVSQSFCFVYGHELRSSFWKTKTDLAFENIFIYQIIDMIFFELCWFFILFFKLLWLSSALNWWFSLLVFLFFYEIFTYFTAKGDAFSNNLRYCRISHTADFFFLVYGFLKPYFQDKRLELRRCHLPHKVPRRDEKT